VSLVVVDLLKKQRVSPSFAAFHWTLYRTASEIKWDAAKRIGSNATRHRNANQVQFNEL